jgi:hypothetical protein
MNRKRGNPNWGPPIPPSPALATEFELRVKQLGTHYKSAISISHAEARSHFEIGRLNTDKGVTDLLDGRKHSCEEITITTSLKNKGKVRMKNLGDDVWGPYVRRSHRVGKFKGWEHAIQEGGKQAIEIADAPNSPRSVSCVSGESQY